MHACSFVGQTLHASQTYKLKDTASHADRISSALIGYGTSTSAYCALYAQYREYTALSAIWYAVLYESSRIKGLQSNRTERHSFLLSCYKTVCYFFRICGRACVVTMPLNKCVQHPHTKSILVNIQRSNANCHFAPHQLVQYIWFLTNEHEGVNQWKVWRSSANVRL